MENKKNIYQRLIDVQKAVQTVEKGSTVKLSEKDKGYKAVKHDDVARLLHLPLAEAGIFMLPDVEKFRVSEFEKVNQWGNKVTWYRTDIEIAVKWINVDNPDDFIISRGAAFAMDTSDKSFAKAYSLALKIILLKVHLLESRDEEEERIFEKQNVLDYETPKKQLPPPKKEEKQNANDIIMPFGSVKGKKIGDIDKDTLIKILAWIDKESSKDPAPKNIKQLIFIKAMVNEVLSEKAPIQDEQDIDPGPTIEQLMEQGPLFDIDEPMPIENKAPRKKKVETNEDDPSTKFKFKLPEFPGLDDKSPMDFTETELKNLIKVLDKELKRVPPIPNIAETFAVKNQMKQFLVSAGVEL